MTAADNLNTIETEIRNRGLHGAFELAYTHQFATPDPYGTPHIVFMRKDDARHAEMPMTTAMAVLAQREMWSCADELWSALEEHDWRAFRHRATGEARGCRIDARHQGGQRHSG